MTKPQDEIHKLYIETNYKQEYFLQHFRFQYELKNATCRQVLYYYIVEMKRKLIAKCSKINEDYAEIINSSQAVIIFGIELKKNPSMFHLKNLSKNVSLALI